MNRVQRANVLNYVTLVQAGTPPKLTDKAYWAQYGSPGMVERRLVQMRADALILAEQRSQQPGFTGTMADLYKGTAFPVVGGYGGPLEESNARVWGKVELTDQTGQPVLRSFSLTSQWYDNVDMLNAEIDDYIADFEDSYGLSDGALVAGSLTFS